MGEQRIKLEQDYQHLHKHHHQQHIHDTHDSHYPPVKQQRVNNKSGSSETQMFSETSVLSGTSKYSRHGCKHFSRSVTATHSFHIQAQQLSIEDYNHMGKIEEVKEDTKHATECSCHPTNSTTDGKTFKCDVVYKYYDEVYGQRPSHVSNRSITGPVRYNHKKHASGTSRCITSGTDRATTDEHEMWSVESQGQDGPSVNKKYNVVGPHVVDDSMTRSPDVPEHDDRRHLLDLEEIVDERSTLGSTKTALV